MPGEEQFFNKLGEIPVLNDGWSTAMGYYSRVKDLNCLTKYTLGMAESGVLKAAEITTPVLSRYQPQIHTVNDYACNKLNELENKYPLIKEPTGKVKDACIEYVQPVVGRVKPVVTYVQGVVDTNKRRVVRIKTCSTNLVVGARDLGVNTVNRAVTVTFDNPPGRLVTCTVDGALTFVEDVVDKHLPGEEANDQGAEAEDGNGHESGHDDEGNVEEMEEMDPSPQRVIVHFKNVSNKVRERMFRKAMRDFRSAKTRTVDALGNLNYTVDLIDYAKKNLNGVRDKVEDMWGQIIDTSEQSGDNAQSGNAGPGSVEERIVMIGRTLARQVRSGVAALEKASNEAGQFVRHPISKSKEYKEFMTQFSTDMWTTSSVKARATLRHIQQMLQSVIDNVESPEWLAMDIEMEDLGLEEGDLNSDNPSEEETDIPRPVNHI